MEEQLLLFKDEEIKNIRVADSIIPAHKDSQKIVDGIEYLKTSSSLWDMRAWKQFHDIEEVIEYVNNPDSKNDSHAQWVVNLIKSTGVNEKTIVGLIMQNNKISFRNRLATCMIERESCPIYIQKGNFSDCNCSERCNTK